jgi:lipid-binding SYLF domain-containing protein
MRTLVTTVTVVLVFSTIASASVNEKERNRIKDAVAVLNDLRSTPDKDIPQSLWERSACVAVIPSVKKAAFVVGGEYGKGLMSCRTQDGWSAPSFMTLEKGSVGFQIGGESVDLVLLVMNQSGMEKLLHNKVSLGTDVSAAAGPIGRDARAATDAQMKAEILSYSRSQGIFAGLDVSGGVLKPDSDANRDLYDGQVDPRQILTDRSLAVPADAKPFETALSHFSATGASAGMTRKQD